MMLRTQFTDLFLEDMLPALETVIWNRYNRFPPQYTKIFNVKSSSRAIEQTSQVSGLGLFTQLGEAASVRYDEPVQGFDKTYKHSRFGLGFRASSDLVEDDKFSLIAKMGVELGRSAKESVEIDVASHFNTAFTAGATAGPDGVALCSTSHPLVKVGGTQANTLSVAADLDVTSLQLALTGYRQMKDSSGKRIRVPVDKLVVASDNEWVASEILSGTMRSDTAEHTVNAFRNRDDAFGSFSKWMVWEYLTDPDSWFLCAAPEDTELRFYWRKQPYTVHDVDFDSQSVKTAMFYRNSHGWSDFYGVYGVQGA